MVVIATSRRRSRVRIPSASPWKILPLWRDFFMAKYGIRMSEPNP